MNTMLGTGYQITPGRFVKVTIALVILLFTVFSIIIPYFIYLDEGVGWTLYITTAILLATYIPILLLAWAYSPQKYILSEKGITIKRPIKPIFIPVEKIRKVEEKDFKSYKLIRKWRNGGLFSITGSFWSKEEGTMHFYAKNGNYVMIHADKKYVLSPDDRFQFVNQLEKYMERRKIGNKWVIKGFSPPLDNHNIHLRRPS